MWPVAEVHVTNLILFTCLNTKLNTCLNTQVCGRPLEDCSQAGQAKTLFPGNTFTFAKFGEIVEEYFIQCDKIFYNSYDRRVHTERVHEGKK